MKIMITYLFISLLLLTTSHSEELTERQKLKAELEQINTSLKPLREKAYRESEVIAARKEVDEAFRKYYTVLRKRMAELSPAQAKDIQRLQELRKLLYGEHSGSRAEDYESAP